MFELIPVGFVRSKRTAPVDDQWQKVPARIELTGDFTAEALRGLEEFSHAEIIFGFHLANPAQVERGSRHPRGNQEWPRTGIFAQRAKDRPNALGLTVVEIVRVEPTTVVVSGLDAIDGSPVFDIKPVLQEFLPRTAVRQPAWTHELMRDYRQGFGQ